MKFFRIDTNLTKLQCEELLDSLSIIEIDELQSLEIISEDIEYDGLITSYVICNDYTILKIKKFLDKKTINYIVDDVSYDILTGKLSLKDTEFERETLQYIEKFLTIDIVLDKINSFGISALTEVDEKCLKNLKI